MSNPYESPYPVEAATATSEDQPLPPPQDPGLVAQVRVVAILMIVQGVLDALMGLFAAGMGLFVSFALRQAMQDDPDLQRGDGPSPEFMSNLMGGIYGGAGLALLAIGFVHMFAGYRNFHFHGRTLGIISMASGILTIVTMVGCYCLPTSIGLCIYGLVVYMNPSVSAAFRMREQGYSVDAILMTFSKYRFADTAGSSPFAQKS
jgi:hypothetical protein